MDELLARLKAAKVYLPQQAEHAAQNFYAQMYRGEWRVGEENDVLQCRLPTTFNFHHFCKIGEVKRMTVLFQKRRS